jgi:hypothetical protein
VPDRRRTTLASFRDRVLVPLLAEVLAAPKPDGQLIEDLVGLIALVPEPAATARSEGAGRVEEVGGGAAEGRRPRAEGARHPQGRVGARARQPAADDPQGELCNAAAAAFPAPGLEPQ